MGERDQAIGRAGRLNHAKRTANFKTIDHGAYGKNEGAKLFRVFRVFRGKSCLNIKTKAENRP